MDRLSIILTLAVGAVLTGGCVILVLSLGLYHTRAIVGAAILGLILSYPASYMISRRIKAQDPDWDETKIEDAGALPDPRAEEV